MKTQYTNASDTPEGFTREMLADGSLDGEDYRVIEFNLPPYPTEVDERERKIRVRVPIGKLPAPMFSEALVDHCRKALGDRDAHKVLDGLVTEYYRQLVLKQI